MGKVTIKHYLNKRSKPVNEKEVYPVYVRVIYNRKNTNFRSEIITNLFLNDDLLDTDAQVALEKAYECDLINAIIEYGEKKMKSDFSLNGISDLIQLFNKSLSCIFLEYALGKEDKNAVRNDVCTFICDKTGVGENVVGLLVSYTICDEIDLMIDLGRKNVLSSQYKYIYEFVKSLEDYENERFGENDRSSYGANKNFNFLEWEYRDGKEKFMKYVQAKKILNDDQVNEYVKLLSEQMALHFEAYVSFTPLRGSRSKRLNC